jgi:hypothetical protein
MSNEKLWKISFHKMFMKSKIEKVIKQGLFSVIVRQSASNIASFLLFSFARAEEAVDFFILYFICFDRKKVRKIYFLMRKGLIFNVI